MTISPANGLALETLAQVDPDLWDAMLAERRRQHDKIELIASENYTSAAVMEAQGSWLTNKYAEGLPGKRYYGGCEYVDVAERLAQERALALFPSAEHVNVQPHSGAQANMAAYFSVLEPGDRIMGMNLAHGGHLTHGMALNFSGRLYEVHAYGVRQDTERIDYDAMAAQAREVRPKLIVGGASAYPRTWDFERMAEIAADVGAILFIDMAHVAGLVAAGVHPSPFPHADLVTTTTHKTLRGPRGGMIFGRHSLRPGLDPSAFPTVKNGEKEGALGASIDRNVFPGTQGGPLMHVVAAKAVAFKLAGEEAFRIDQRRTIENARVMAETLASEGARVVSGGTDNHLLLVDVTPLGVTGKEAEHLLDEIGITVNKNAIPFDTLPPNTASGIRIGTPATTSRGFGPDEMRAVGRIIIEAIRRRDDQATSTRLAGEVTEIVSRFRFRACPPRDRIGIRRGAAPTQVAMTFITGAAAAVGPIIVVLVAAALISLLLTPVVRRVFLRYEVVDHPEARRVNTVPVPRGGGLAVCAAFLVVASAFLYLNEGGRFVPIPFSLAPSEVAALLLGGAIAAGLGAIDDLFDLRARMQLLGQIGLALFAVALGITIDFIANPLGGPSFRFSGPVGAGLTVFWIVGMINSINWIDGLDGLSTGVALIAAVTLGMISLSTQVSVVGQPLIAVLCFALAGALLGFLRWNFNPASIFTGTSGVQFVGFTLAVLAILGVAKVAVALLVLGVPIIDTFWIIVRRVSQGRSPFSPDRTHIHHRLLDLGLSHRQTVLAIYGICLALAILSMLLSGVTQLYAFLGIFVAFGLVLFLPTRGDFDRPDELEADAYEPEVPPE